MDLNECARRLVAARRDRSLVANAELAAIDTLEAGRSVQQAFTALYGEKVIGWKVAMPPEGVVCAPIYADGRFVSGASVPLDAGLRDGIECELAFTLERPLPPCREGGLAADEVLPAFGLMSAAFELLQCRLEQRFASPRPQLLADHFSNGGIVVGEPRRDWRSLDLTAIELSLHIDGAEILRQRGGNPLGDPRRGLTALANHLGARGMTIEVGQVVMTGAFTGIHRVEAGQRVRLAFDGVEAVELCVT